MRVKLGEVCRFINGDRGKNYPSQAEISNDGDVPFINAGHIDEGKLNFSEMNYISKEKYDQLNSGKIQKNDVLYCLRGSLGKKTIVKDISKGAIASSLVIIRPDADKIDSDYLYYALESPTVQKQMIQANNGSSQPNLSAKSVSEYTFNLPDINTQRIVVSKLGIATYLIDLRKQQLSKLDELVKARFVELFGDPVQNSMGWKTDYLKNVTSKIGSGATPKGGKESYQSDGITLIRSMNVHDGRFEYKDLAHITDEQAKQLDNVTIEENDVFINITGASVARSCIVPKHILPARVNQHVAIIRCITSMFNPVFANNMFLNHSFKGQLLDIGETGGATRQAITKQQLETLKVLLPPIDLQNQFAVFVEQTDKSKLAVQKSLDELETLKKLLMQQYFG